MSRFDTISFLSDYGNTDEFVGVAKSVVRSIAPDVAVIDITHEIEPHDIRAGGLALARSVQYLAPGVVLAVVDPGVATDRLAVAVEVADGAAYLVGPDNGLLAPAVSMVGGATGAFVLDNPDYHLPAPGPTFAGRDVFAPMAAHLCNGVPLDELGTSIDPIKLKPGVLPVSQLEDDGSIVAEVLWVDRFGNAQLNVDPGDLATWPAHVLIAGGRTERTALRVESYAQIATGAVGLVIDSYGLLSIAIDQGSAAFELQLEAGQEVRLNATDGPAVASSPVTLTAKPTTVNPEDGQ
ncbi:MAG: S-adenosylmethionine hydrolase [Acidimicrobiales bacterium]|jgi:S-adenosyl-L-methionine hydrolase (adenosine-forming)